MRMPFCFIFLFSIPLTSIFLPLSWVMLLYLTTVMTHPFMHSQLIQGYTHNNQLLLCLINWTHMNISIHSTRKNPLFSLLPFHFSARPPLHIVLFYSCLSLNFRDFLAATSDILVSRTHSSSNSASVAFIFFLSLFTCFCSLLFPAVKMSPIWLTSQQTDSLLQLSCDSLLLVPTARSSTEITQVNFF